MTLFYPTNIFDDHCPELEETIDAKRLVLEALYKDFDEKWHVSHGFNRWQYSSSKEKKRGTQMSPPLFKLV